MALLTSKSLTISQWKKKSSIPSINFGVKCTLSESCKQKTWTCADNNDDIAEIVDVIVKVNLVVNVKFIELFCFDNFTIHVGLKLTYEELFVSSEILQ